MAGKYRLTYFANRKTPRVARPGDAPTRARAGDGSHVMTRRSTTAEERSLDTSSQPATSSFTTPARHDY